VDQKRGRRQPTSGIVERVIIVRLRRNNFDNELPQSVQHRFPYRNRVSSVARQRLVEGS
jgi:hypothetical protein